MDRKKGMYVCIVCFLLLGAWEQVDAETGCRALTDIQEGAENSDNRAELLNTINGYVSRIEGEFDFYGATSGYQIELCESASVVEIFRVGPIKSRDSVSYVVRQSVCLGTRELKFGSHLLDKEQDLGDSLLCNYAEPITGMCLESQSDCEIYHRKKFIRTDHISTNEFQPIIRFVDTFRKSEGIKFGQEVIHKKTTLEVLNWIHESRHEPEVLNIEYHDYTAQNAYSGRFQVVARQGQRLWSAVLQPNVDGLKLVYVGFLDI